MAAEMNHIRLGDVIERCIVQAKRAGRKPTRLLFGPEIWPCFAFAPKMVPHLDGSVPEYRGLPCFKMHAPGVAVVT